MEAQSRLARTSNTREETNHMSANAVDAMSIMMEQENRRIRGRYGSVSWEGVTSNKTVTLY
jgi:hypothetical protein